jgi:hypothetical protein
MQDYSYIYALDVLIGLICLWYLRRLYMRVNSRTSPPKERKSVVKSRIKPRKHKVVVNDDAAYVRKKAWEEES